MAAVEGRGRELRLGSLVPIVRKLVRNVRIRGEPFFFLRRLSILLFAVLRICLSGQAHRGHLNIASVLLGGRGCLTLLIDLRHREGTRC